MGPPGQEPVDSDLHLGCGGPTPFCAAWGRQLEAHPSVNERDAPPGTVLPAAVCMWPGLESVQDGRSPQAEPQTPSSQCACRGPARRKRAHPATGRAPSHSSGPASESPRGCTAARRGRVSVPRGRASGRVWGCADLSGHLHLPHFQKSPLSRHPYNRRLLHHILTGDVFPEVTLPAPSGFCLLGGCFRLGGCFT